MLWSSTTRAPGPEVRRIRRGECDHIFGAPARTAPGRGAALLPAAPTGTQVAPGLDGKPLRGPISSVRGPLFAAHVAVRGYSPLELPALDPMNREHHPEQEDTEKH